VIARMIFHSWLGEATFRLNVAVDPPLGLFVSANVEGTKVREKA